MSVGLLSFGVSGLGDKKPPYSDEAAEDDDHADAALCCGIILTRRGCNTVRPQPSARTCTNPRPPRSPPFSAPPFSTLHVTRTPPFRAPHLLPGLDRLYRTSTSTRSTSTSPLSQILPPHNTLLRLGSADRHTYHDARTLVDPGTHALQSRWAFRLALREKGHLLSA